MARFSGPVDGRMLGEAVRFSLVGVVNTLVYLAVYLALVLALPYLLAHVLAYATGVVVSFFLNARFTYRTSPTLSKFLLFPLTQVPGLLATTVGLTLLVEVAGVDERVAAVLAVLLALPFAFLLSRWVLTGRGVFAPRPHAPSDDHGP